MITFFIGFLTVLLGLVCILMVFIVLMQKPKQEGLGAAFGGGVTDSMWGADATNILQKITVWLAVLFFAITMLLAVLVGVKQKAKISKEQLTTIPEKPTTQGAATNAGQPATSTTPPPTTITTDPIEVPPVLDPATETPETTEPATETPETTEPAAETPETTEPAAETPEPKPTAEAIEPETKAPTP